MHPGLANIERALATGGDPRADAFAAIAASAEKAATVDDTLIESAEDARNRRVADLVRRRQPSGLTTGTASPTPPGN